MTRLVSEDVRFISIIICHFIPLEAGHAFSRWEDREKKGQGGGEDKEGRVATFWQECDYCFTFHPSAIVCRPFIEIITLPWLTSTVLSGL